MHSSDYDNIIACNHVHDFSYVPHAYSYLRLLVLSPVTGVGVSLLVKPESPVNIIMI